MNKRADPSNHEPAAPKKPGRLPLHQRLVLKKIARARTRLLVCCWTLPVYITGLWVLLSNGRAIDTFMFIYMALFAGFALDMSLRRCPQCHEQFFVKSILLNLITRQCLHCGVLLHVENSAITRTDEDQEG